MQRTRLAIVIVLALAAPATAFAQPQANDCKLAPEPPQGQAVLTALSLAYRNCLGKDTELAANDLTRRVVNGIPIQDGERSRAEVRLIVLGAIDQISKALRPARSQTQDPAVQGIFDAIASDLATVRVGVDEIGTPMDRPALNNRNWTWNPNANRFGELSASLDPVAAACGQPGPSCTSAYTAGIVILRATHLTDRALSFYNNHLITTAHALTKQRDARWTSYFSETAPQFPWEVLWNGAIFAHRTRETKGFGQPPQWQLIALHPDVGFEYAKAAVAGSRFKPAIVFEAIGFNQWSWNDENKPSRSWGLSAVIVWSDRAESTAPGYGVLARVGTRYSVAVTKRSGDTSFTVSSTLSQLLTGANEKLKTAMRFGGKLTK